MPGMERRTLLETFHGMVARREPIIGGGAGTGLSAKCEEAGGIDLIVIYNSGRYRMAGRGSLAGLLAYGNANEIVKEMAREVIPVVRRTPVLAGVNGTDPFLVLDAFLDELKALGFSGVQNFPTVGLIDGVFRANLEETGMGFGLEVEMIRAAHEADLLTTPYVFSEADAVAMRKPAPTSSSATWAHDQRVHRRADREVAGRVRAAHRRMGAGGAGRARGHYRALPRRADRIARGRHLRAAKREARARLLRRQQHGAPAHRERDDGADQGLQGDRFLTRRRPRGAPTPPDICR